MLDLMQKELELPMLKTVFLPVTAHTIKPVEKHYYSTLMTPMIMREPQRWTRKTVEMEDQTFFYEYQDCNLWFDNCWEMPIFGKFDFLKDLK